MELMTVAEVSKTFGVSTRMLHYYEKLGLLQSMRREDYAYRIYDETAVRRLRQIILLRKLRIPLKQVKEILDDPRQETAMEIFQSQVDQLDRQIKALDVVRKILQNFIGRNYERPVGLLDDRHLIAAAERLEQPKNTRKETYAVNGLDKADKTMDQMVELRIVLLPPFTVAAAHYVGENPEDHAGELLDGFIRESRLYEKKPDSRAFGFNHPNPTEPGAVYGYEYWVTIPPEMEVPAPLEKKQFVGGLYAAHTINFPEFYRWKELADWVRQSDDYIENYSPQGEEIMGGCLEEHLNWVYASHMNWEKPGDYTGKLDLLMPVKRREPKGL